MIKDRKKTKILIGVCVCVLGMGMPVMAENSLRRANIKSKGSIEFEEGKVSIASSDLTYLADEIDHLESTYKITTVDALNSIGTYFKNDGSITYDNGQNEADTEEEKTILSFGSIKEGIKNSQSVESLSSLQATDKGGNLLYYADEAAQANGDLKAVTTTDTGYPVYYKAAAAENLSAGTAAWVNGNLIKGNGSDNAAYVEQGYQSGYTDGYHQGSSDGYAQGAEAAKVQIICLGQLGNDFNLTAYKEYKNFKVGTNIFFVPSSMTVTVYNNFAHYYTGSSHDDDVLGASSSGSNSALLNYDSNTGILTSSTTASTGNAQVKEYDGHGYNFDASDASAKVTIAGNVYLIY